MNLLSILLFIFSCISLFCCIFILYTYLNVKVLRRFPSNIIMWRAVADLIFSIHIIITVFLITSDESVEDGSQYTSCVVLNFIRQFSLSASLGWFFCLTLNYYFSVRNPFQRPDRRLVYYHIFVWSSSLFTACLAASQSEYRANYGLCYTSHERNVNVINWVTFIGWLLFFWVAAIAALLYCWYLLRPADYHKVLNTREELIQFSFRNIFVFQIFWTVVGFLYFVIYQYEHDRNILKSDRPADFYKAFSTILSCLGIVDFISWILTQKKRYLNAQVYASITDLLSRSTTSRIQQQLKEADISSALRREFIIYTTRGIEEAVLMYQRTLRKDNTATPPFDPNSVKLTKKNSNVNLNETSHLKHYFPEYSRNFPPSLTLSRNTPGKDVFYFQDYYPEVFEDLRSNIFDCSSDEYLASLTGDDGDVEIIEEFFSEGKSGSFLYFSPNRRFIVKTLTYQEHCNLIEFIVPYFDYMKMYGENESEYSLINRIYGCYSIEMYGHTQYFVVMQNCLWSPSGIRIHEKYDLKGSWIDRHISPLSSSDAVRKDNDFRDNLNIAKDKSYNLVAQICRDVYFLQSLDIMDYSLLVGVHNCMELRPIENNHCTARPPENTLRYRSMSGQERSPQIGRRVALHMDDVDDRKYIAGARRVRNSKFRDKRHLYNEYFGGLSSENICGAGIYYLGIIDVLQTYDWQKRLENWYKRFIKCYDKFAMSSIPSKQYAERFILMMLERLELSVASLSIILKDDINIEIRAHRVDESFNKRYLPEARRREFLIRCVYKQHFIIEQWENVESVMSVRQDLVEEYMSHVNVQIPTVDDDEIERALKRSSFYGASSTTPLLN